MACWKQSWFWQGKKNIFYTTVRKWDEDIEDLDEDVYCSIEVTKNM